MVENALWCFQHVAIREALHLSASTGLTVGMLLTWSEVARAGWLWRLHGLSFWLVPPILGVVLFVALKEPFDVQVAGANACQAPDSDGDPAWKSLVDITFWTIGCVLSSYGLYRLAPRLHGARDATQRQLRQMRARRIRDIR